MGGSPTQTLNQNVCQKYGWGIVYGADDVTGYWVVEIYVTAGAAGRRDRTTTGGIKPANPHRYTVPIPSGEKRGKAAVSETALLGLKDAIHREESKKTIALRSVFPDPIVVVDSSKRESSWERFWRDPPDCVGIDAEGNQISPPVLVQISTENYTILEVPVGGTLSADLTRLLETDSITKVFCDNFSNRDKKCLGLNIGGGDGDNHDADEGSAAASAAATKPRFIEPPIVDIEILALELFGTSQVPRGLSKLISLCMPERNVRIEKPGKSWKQRHRNIGRFALIEQGKAKPLKGLHDLNENQQQYAALDSWCTLKIYQRMLQEIEKINGASAQEQCTR